MADVYSTQVVNAQSVNGGPFAEFPVPAGKLLVVKSLSIVWGDITVSGLDAWFQGESLAKLVRYTWGATLSSPTNLGGTAQWWGMWVFEPGDVISVQTATGTCDMHAGGYLLSLP